MNLPRCSTCSAPILWVVMAATGRKMPLDADPHPEGNVELIGDNKARVLNRDQVALARCQGTSLYRSHFATCRFAQQQKKARTS